MTTFPTPQFKTCPNGHTYEAQNPGAGIPDPGCLVCNLLEGDTSPAAKPAESEPATPPTT